MAGARISAAIVDHFVRAYRSTRVEMAPHNVDLFMAIQEAFFGLTGQESSTNVGPILRQLLDTDALDVDTRRLVEFVVRGHGQLATMLGTSITGQAVSVGLGALFSDLLQPAVGRLIAGNPALPIGLDAVARAQATGITHGLDTVFEARQQGIDDRKLAILTDLARPEPDASTLMDLVNRERMSLPDAIALLQRAGYRREDAIAILETRLTPVSPTRLADGVTFGALTYSDALHRARQAGMSDTDFDLLVNTNGMPPSNEELAFALRRGVIDHPTYLKGLQQGPLRNEWIPLVEKMVLIPMSVADAIEAVAKGHMTEDQAKSIALQNGLQPEHYQPLRDSAGSPPGVQEMIQLWQRGDMTEAELDQGIRESRLMNKYIPTVKKFAEHLPPERTVVSLAAKGLVTPARAFGLLKQLGFADDIAHALLDESHQTKTAAAHTLAQSQIIALYEDRAITSDQAVVMLTGLRYTPEDAAWLLKLADLARRKKFTDSAIGSVHAAYKNRHIGDNEASDTLDALHIPPDQRDDLLTLWRLELAVEVKTLTLPQLHAALKAGVIDGATFAARVAALGYTDTDAGILVALYAPQAQ